MAKVILRSNDFMCSHEKAEEYRKKVIEDLKNDGVAWVPSNFDVFVVEQEDHELTPNMMRKIMGLKPIQPIQPEVKDNGNK